MMRCRTRCRGSFRASRKEAASPQTLDAHILDANTGYTKQTWTVGEDVHPDLARYASENGALFVVVTYDDGRAKTAIFKQEAWGLMKGLFDVIDGGPMSALEKSLTQMGSLIQANFLGGDSVPSAG
jgi:hypothetical protein